MTIKNENRRTTAQSIIDATINTIELQLEKIPLPPGSKDRHFDFERIINENVRRCLRFLIGARNGGKSDPGFTINRATGE
jgi:hypothetical protein